MSGKSHHRRTIFFSADAVGPMRRFSDGLESRPAEGGQRRRQPAILETCGFYYVEYTDERRYEEGVRRAAQPASNQRCHRVGGLPDRGNGLADGQEVMTMWWKPVEITLILRKTRTGWIVTVRVKTRDQ